MYLSYSAEVAVTNCVLWGDRGEQEIYCYGSPPAKVSYSCVQGGHEGAGNFDADPMFADAEARDLRLRAGSPCIDAADGDAAPATDISGSVRLDDRGVADAGSGVIAYADVGAYEFQDNTAAGVTVSGPAEGSGWVPGQETLISWTATGDVLDVRIELSRDGGVTWEVIAESTPNNRGHAWTVTDGGLDLPQADCRLRVSDVADELSGTSPPFAIFDGAWYVDAAAPSGGEGVTWASAFRHPMDALDAAMEGNEVWVAEGVYDEPRTSDPHGTGENTGSVMMKGGVHLYGGFSGA